MRHGISIAAGLAMSAAAAAPSFAGWSIDNAENFNGRPIIVAENDAGGGNILALACGAGYMHLEAVLPIRTADGENKKVSFQVDGNAPREIRGVSYDDYFASIGNNNRPTKGVQNVIAEMARGKTLSIVAIGRKATKSTWSLKGFGKAYNTVKANCP